MGYGQHLQAARRHCGMTQETVAEALGISRQTVSKWELDETMPNIEQFQKLAALYRLSMDQLIAFDATQQAIEQLIEQTSEETQQKMDWHKIWSKRYPILETYRHQVKIEDYAPVLSSLLEKLRAQYGYSDEDAFLVLKDILAQLWQPDAR